MPFPRCGSVWVHPVREKRIDDVGTVSLDIFPIHECMPSLRDAGLEEHGQVTVMMGSSAVCSRQQKKKTKKRTHTVQVSRVFVLPLYFFRIISIPFFFICSMLRNHSPSQTQFLTESTCQFCGRAGRIFFDTEPDKPWVPVSFSPSLIHYFAAISCSKVNFCF